MYLLVSAIAKPLSGDGRWRDLNIGNLPLYQLFADYKKVIVVLRNTFFAQHVSFNIETIRVTHGSSPLTIQQFLLANGNKSLPTLETLPQINTRYARYADGFHAEYKIDPTHPTASFDSQMPATDKTWLRLTKTGVDYQHFYESCLVNVNGFYHLTDYSVQAAYVVEGMKCAHKANRNELGILNFESLGKLKFIPITDSMIYKQSERQQLINNCYVDTGVNLASKTVMLVLGGYLHVLDKRTFYRVSPSSFAIDFSNLPLLERFFESKDVLDLSSLGLEHAPSNPDQVSVEQLYSDECLRKYLTLSQSFFVVLDNPDIFTEEVALRASPFPGVYTSYAPPIYPLRVGAGKHESYWYNVEHGLYSVHVNASLRGNRLFDGVTRKALLSLAGEVEPTISSGNTNVQFFLIGTDI
jgi:hypothetical protein